MLDQIDLTDIYRTFPPTAEGFIFLSSPHRTFSKIDHVLGHKTGLNKFKKIEIILSNFSDHNGIKLKISNNKKVGKYPT